VSSNELRPLSKAGESHGTKKGSKAILAQKVDSLAKIQKFEVQIGKNETNIPVNTAMAEPHVKYIFEKDMRNKSSHHLLLG